MHPFDTQSLAILNFYQNLNPEFELPLGVELMNPFQKKATWELTKQFYQKFFSDRNKRTLIFGINPGRFGGGVTGIPFTDPLRLEKQCQIPNGLAKKSELSSEFVYQVIHLLGGPEQFYRRFFITAICPLGFTRRGKNLNYYDDRNLKISTEPFIVQTLQAQIRNIRSSSTAFCIGEGENFRFFSRLNEHHRFFQQIIPLPHPRWIMQYRRKSLRAYIGLYCQRLTNSQQDQADEFGDSAE